MQRLTIWSIPVAILAIAGCASSSGVFPSGPGTYQITTTAITSFGGTGSARASGVKTAQDYCARQGKQMQAVNATSDAQFTQGSSDLTFRCVATAPE